MNSIKRLIEIFGADKIGHVLALDINKGGQVWQLFKAVETGLLKTDEEGEQYFFAGHPSARRYFKDLKERLIDKIVNTVFFQHLSDLPFNVRIQGSCYQQAAASNILMWMGAKEVGTQLGEKVVKRAIKYHVTDVIVGLARKLMIYHGTVEGDLKKYNKYKQLLEYYTPILNAEVEAEICFADVGSSYVRTRMPKKGLKQKLARHAQTLKELLEQHDSYLIRLISYNIWVLQQYANIDYKAVIVSCRKALRYFKELPFDPPAAAFFSFMYYMIPSLTLLKQYEQAQNAIDECLNGMLKGSYNWLITLHYQLILAFHSEEYALAFQTLQVVKPFRNNFKEPTREQWLINEAYVQLYIEADIIDAPKSRRRPFRINKFLNEVPIFSQDKRGNNIHILILQILFLLKRKRYGLIIDRMEALNQYCHRHLRKDDTFRSNCFIKALLQLPIGSFHRTAVERKTRSIIQKLKSVPLECAHQGGESEIIPYEVLWQFVLDILDHRIYNVNRNGEVAGLN